MVKNPAAITGDLRDVDSILGSGISPGGGHGTPLQYSWASLVAQLVKNPPAMWETWVFCLLVCLFLVFYFFNFKIFNSYMRSQT